MISAIRRRFTNSIEEDAWDTDREFGPEVGESSELHTDAAVLLASAQTAPGYFRGDESLTDYYKDIVRTAIENRGRYGDHWIPVPWLRMILAGLESRHIDPDLLWYEADIDSAAVLGAEVPSYEELFPSEGDLARLR
ncbi:MAG: hypothetical protein JRN06_09740 [Nitrososphaerota archaeon]|nr:hypothetical protein [Nitrososphaerota archaeon]MDG7024867.1 hypothetical protein [Nitrososphaerota archaeon]